MSTLTKEIDDYNARKLEEETKDFLSSLTREQRLSLRRVGNELTNDNVDSSIITNKKYPFMFNYVEYSKAKTLYLNPIYEKLQAKYGNSVVTTFEFFDTALKYFVEDLKVDSVVASKILEMDCLQQTITYNWNIYKQCYKFNEDTLNFLLNETTYEEIPIKVLKDNLPFDCFAIDNQFELEDVKIKSVIVQRTLAVKDKDSYRLDECLNLFFILDTKDFDYFYGCIPLIDDSDYTIDETVEGMHDYELTIKRCIKKVVSLIIYLCSDNKEIRYIEHKNSYEKNHSKYQKKKGITTYDVGYDLGNTIKQTKVVYVNPYQTHKEKGVGSPKRPHARCGHFHHFWVGSIKENNRKLIVKFVAPTFVNGGNQKAIVHNVK